MIDGPLPAEKGRLDDAPFLFSGVKEPPIPT